MKGKKGILKLYNEYTQTLHKVTKEYTKKFNEFCDMKENFDKQLNEEQIKELDKILDLVFEINKESDKDTFIYAYSLGVTLTTEVFWEERIKKINTFNKVLKGGR